jgi:biotin carboxyl carrier protein
MSEVTAPKDGTITKILVENGDFIEFDQPLFTIQE